MADARTAKIAEMAKSPAHLRAIMRRFIVIVRGSVEVDIARAQKARVPFDLTDAEVRRRTNILYDWFLQLRCDLGFGTDHALDTLPFALRATLDDDQTWVPPLPERTWAPS